MTIEEVEADFDKTLLAILVAEDKEKVILEAIIKTELLLMKLEKANYDSYPKIKLAKNSALN